MGIEPKQMLSDVKPHSMKSGVEQPDDTSVWTWISLRFPVQRNPQILYRNGGLKSTMYVKSTGKIYFTRSLRGMHWAGSLQIFRSHVHYNKSVAQQWRHMKCVFRFLRIAFHFWANVYWKKQRFRSYGWIYWILRFC